MSLYRSFLSNLIFLLQVVLILLLIFKNQLVVPTWLQDFGRFHPLLLHFPIVLIILLPVFSIFRKAFGENHAMENVFGFLLIHAAFFVTLSALSGLFLSVSGGYDADLLQKHLIAGSVTAILCFIVWLGYAYGWFKMALIRTLVTLNCIILVIGSHYGGSLTHGEEYLTGTEEETIEIKQRVVTDSSAIFEAAVLPVLETKCFSCHNEKKAKGNLIMTDIQQMLKGGKDGPLWVAGDPLNSHIMKRLMLDVGDKKHMPPKGKPQLTYAEIQLIETWISYGADTKKNFRDYAVDDSLRVLAAGFVQTSGQVITDTTTYLFPPADEKIIAKLVSPFRTITPRSLNSPALHVSYFVRAYYEPRMLTELQPLKTQVVSINLSNMPIKDEMLKELGTFSNLEYLFLNGTDITGSGFAELKKCLKLKALSLANTKVLPENLDKLAEIPSLKKVFLWNSLANDTITMGLQTKYPLISWDRGFVPDTAEKLKLTAPQLADPDQLVLQKGSEVKLKHPLPGTVIRYSLDGTDPDSLNGTVYDRPLIIDTPVTIKAIAVLPGWYSSAVSSYQLFTAGKKPVDVRLRYPPDPKYALNGGASLVDNEKGDLGNNLLNWMGFRQKPFEAVATFSEPQPLTKVVLSIADNTGGYLFPPEYILIKGGNDSTKLEVIGRFDPVQPKKYGPARIKPYTVPVKPGTYKFIEIEARNVQSLPKWHSGKKQKGWIFVDEIFFE